jgi:hypothetical protein
MIKRNTCRMLDNGNMWETHLKYEFEGLLYPPENDWEELQQKIII